MGSFSNLLIDFKRACQAMDQIYDGLEEAQMKQTPTPKFVHLITMYSFYP